MQSVSELAKLLKPYIVQWSLSATGGTSAGGGASGTLTTHTLSGASHSGTLADAQAPQFLKLAGTRSMTGNLNMGNYAITNVSTIDGVDIESLASLSYGNIIAGTGLTGGGQLADGDVTLNVDVDGLAGNGIVNTSNTFAINSGDGLVITSDVLKVSTDSTLEFSGSALSVDTAGIAGNGLTGAGKILAVNTGDGIQISSDAVAVRASDLAGSGLTSGSNNLLVNAGDGILVGSTVEVDESYTYAWTGVQTHSANVASAGAVVGTSGWTLLPTGAADFRDITADSLTIDTFIADVNLALAGSEYITKSGATVSRDFTVPSVSATLYVYDLPGSADTQVFENGDYVALRFVERGTGLEVGTAWGTVSSYADLTDGEQSWLWTRTSGTTGKTIYAGMWAIDYGTSGDGVIKSTVTDSTSPYIDIQTWASSPELGANFTTKLRAGNLSGITDTYMTPSGYGIYTDNLYAQGELVLAAGDVVLDDDGVNLKAYTSGSGIPYNSPNAIAWWENATDRNVDEDIAKMTGKYYTTGGNTYRELYTQVYTGGSTGTNRAIIEFEAEYADPDSISANDSKAFLTLNAWDTGSDAVLKAFQGQITLSSAGGIIEVIADEIKPNGTVNLGNNSFKFNELHVNTIFAGTTSSTDTGHNHNNLYYSKTEVDTSLSGKANSSHSHAQYALDTDLTSGLAGKADASHNHNSTYYTETEVDSMLLNYASDTHSHGDLYYTETEVDALLAALPQSGHTHPFTEVTGSLAWSRLDLASASLADITTRPHSALTGIGVNDHHAQVHDINGSDHTGTLAWSKVSKTGSNLTDLATRAHSGLTGIGANDHHTQVHDIDGGDHTGTLSWAKLNKANSDIADLGGAAKWGVTAPLTLLTRDFTTSDTVIYVKHNVFSANDYAFIGQSTINDTDFEPVQITGSAIEIGGGTEYSYTVTRLNTSTAFDRSGLEALLIGVIPLGIDQVSNSTNFWAEGSTITSLGYNAGDGLIEIDDSSTTFGHAGPTLGIYRRRDNFNWNSISNVVRFGNLDGSLDYSSGQYGMAVGTSLDASVFSSGLSAISLDATNGARLINTGLHVISGQSEKATLSSDPKLIFGDDVSNVTFASGNGLFLGKDTDGIYKVKLGNSEANSSISWDGSTFVVDAGATFGTDAFSNDPIKIGSPAIGGGIGIDTTNTNREIYFEESEVIRFQIGHTGSGAGFLEAGSNLDLRVNSSTVRARYPETSAAEIAIEESGIDINRSIKITNWLNAINAEYNNAIAVNVPTNSTEYTAIFNVDSGDFSSLNGIGIRANSDANEIDIASFDNGTDYAPVMRIGRNKNATTPSAGALVLTAKNGVQYYLFVDVGGDLRLSTVRPTNSNDATTGVIVGTQS